MGFDASFPPHLQIPGCRPELRRILLCMVLVGSLSRHVHSGSIRPIQSVDPGSDVRWSSLGIMVCRTILFRQAERLDCSEAKSKEWRCSSGGDKALVGISCSSFQCK